MDSFSEMDQDNTYSSIIATGSLQDFLQAQDNEDDKILDNAIGEKRSKEKFKVDCLSYELQVGYRILNNLMGTGNRFINKFFLYPIDDTFPETADYYKKIKNPMWMFRMKEKFERQEYSDLAEFMTDFRVMIENCYRFNGPDCSISKKAQKLETMMKQKVALLSRELRDKLSNTPATNTDDDILTLAGLRRRVKNPNVSMDDASQQLLSQLRQDRVLQERVGRRQKIEDRKAMEQARVQELQTWEDNLLGPEVKNQIRTMWELPQIGLFVYLCMESLGLEEEVTQYQIERGLAIPRECSDFQRLITCLLSTPNQRKSVKSLMPYHVWNAKLASKLDYFYKVLSDNNGSQVQACFVLGLDTRAFKVMGKVNPMLKKKFHELSYLKRVWVLKNFCDFCLETQPYLQKTIEDIEAVRPMDVREVQLGSDGRGNCYINFPMFTGKDIRIYKHSKHQEPTLESLSMENWAIETVKVSASSSTFSTPVNQKTSHVTKASLSSTKARAILQAAEAKESSPSSEIPHVALDTQNSNYASNNLTTTSNTEDTVSGKQTSAKKRKRTGLYFSKRKRLKPDKKDSVGNKECIIQSNVNEKQVDEKEERVINNSGDASAVDDQKTIKDNTSSLICDTADKGDNIINTNASSNSEKSSSHTTESETGYKSKIRTEYEDKDVLSYDELTLSAKHQKSDIFNGIPQEFVKAVNDDIQQDDSAYFEKDKSSRIKTKGNIGSFEKATDSVIKNEVKPEIGSYSDSTDSFTINKHPTEATVKEMNGFVPANTKTESNIVNDMKSTNLKCEPLTTNNSSSIKQEIKNETIDISHKQESNIKTSDCKFELTTNNESATQFVSDTSDKKERDSDGINSSDMQNVKLEENKLNLKVASEENTELKSNAVKNETETMIKAEEEDSDEEDLLDLDQIELVAENMEEIRHLINKLSNPEPTKKGKKLIPGVVKPCEEELIAALTGFLEELTKYERSLCNARIEMQTKLRKDIETYVEPKIEETKDWDSDHSNSSKDVSEDEESDSKVLADIAAKPTNKGKQKQSASSMLSSVASKLATPTSKLPSLAEEGNEDSSDSYELDISSRGRLRKRRIIPNNTEDTGLKRRKNLQNQDAIFSSVSTNSSITYTTAPPSLWQYIGSNIPSSTIVSLLKSNNSANSAIKAQLVSKTTRPNDGLIHLMPGSSDGKHTVTALAGNKPGIVRSSLSLSNMSVASRPGIHTVLGNKVLTSSAQISHPVMQRMLNQTNPLQSTTNTATAFTTMSSSGLPLHPSRTKTLIQAPLSSVAKSSSVVINVPSTQATTAKSHNIISHSPASVVVTMVSTSVSQGGKQVIDLGSLSISQLQQLLKNQAVQINTGDGGPAMLLLTAGLQHQLPARVLGTPSSLTTGLQASQSFDTNPLIRLPANHSVPQESGRTGVPSLLSVGNNIQAVSNSHTSSMLNSSAFFKEDLRKVVIANAPATQPQTYVKVNMPDMSQAAASVFHGLPNSTLQSTLSRTTSVIPSTPSTMLVSSTQLGSVPKNAKNSSIRNVVSLTAAQKHIPTPRIISSLTLTNPAQIALGVNSALPTQTSSGNYSVVISGNITRTPNTDAHKSRIITVPLVQLSPPKNPGCNLTVKALLENRGAKKSKEDDSDASICEPHKLSQIFNNGIVSNTTLNASDISQVKNVALMNMPKEVDKRKLGVDQTFTESEYAGDSAILTDESYTSTRNIHGQTNGTTTFVSTSFNPLTLSLSVDTSISSLSTFPSEINLPTMNMKVPCPNTLPSLQHNKNGTTIVQSTKVPIPVATEAKSGDSLSPSLTLAPSSVHHGAVLQSLTSVPRVHPAVENLVVIPGDNTSLLSAVRAGNSSTVIPVNSSQLNCVQPASVAGLKNIVLKVTPQGQGSGQLVQGFMTSRGLVIPQAAILQQANPAGQGVVLSSGSLTHLEPGSLQMQPSSVLGTGKQQTILSFNNISQGSTADQEVKQQQLAKNVFVAASTLASNISQSPKSNIQVMFVRAPALSTVYPISSTTTVSTQQKQTIITTPASELVKQIANNTQAGLQHKVAIDAKPSITVSSTQQNTVHLINNIVQASSLQPGSSNTNIPVQNVVSIPTTISSQLKAQILTLQQNKKLQEQQQGNVVLTAKPIVNQGVLPSPNKQSNVTFQLQQPGQLSSYNLTAPNQLGGLQQPSGTSIQQVLGPRVAQPNQVLQLAIRQPSVSKTMQTAPNLPQTIHVQGQPSLQQQLTNQRLALIQPSGKIVIQQPLNQRVILQPLLASNAASIQPGINSLQVNNLQQHSTKTTLQRPQAPTVVSKDQLATNTITQNQQLVSSTPQVPNLVISQLQVPTASVTSVTFTQPQAQLFISPSTNSMSTFSIGNASAISPAVNKLQIGTFIGNINQTRADTSVIPASLNSQPTAIQEILPQNQLKHTMTLGSTVLNASTPTSKADTHVVIPSCGVSQYIVPSIKLNSQNQQLNISNPVRVVYAQTPGTGIIPSQTAGSVIVNNPLLKKVMVSPGASIQENNGTANDTFNFQNNVHSQVSVKPAVIYAGQPSIVTDIKEGNIAHILQSQPVASVKNAQVNNLQPVTRLQSSSLGTQQLRPEFNNSLTFVYRIGDQYFSPTTDVGQFIPQTSLSATSFVNPGNMTTTSKPEVQLLVPPAFIEASDKILQQNVKTQIITPQMPSSASGISETLSGRAYHILSQDGDKNVRKALNGTGDSTSQNLKASVNGTHMATNQISFSLPSPLSMTNKQPISSNCATISAGLSDETSSDSLNLENSASVFESLLNIQNMHSANIVSRRNTLDRNSVGSNQFIVNQTVLNGPALQRHPSSDELAHAMGDQDEKEAAMNLLTLANQQI